MPLNITHEGKPLTVYTQEELNTAVAGAKTGLLSEDDAKKLADTAAAAARRDAEKKLGELQAELAKAGNSAEQVTKLQAQVAEQAAKLTGAERALKGMKVLVGAGVTAGAAEQLLALPALSGADFDSDAGQAKAVESVKGLFPQLFPAQTQQTQQTTGTQTQQTTQQTNLQPVGGVGSSPAPAGGPLTYEQVKAMTPEQINANWEAVQAAMKATATP